MVNLIVQTIRHIGVKYLKYHVWKMKLLCQGQSEQDIFILI